MPHHTYQHRAYTSRAGYARIAEVLRHNCDLYNAARLERMTAWKQARKSRTFYDQCKELTDIRADDPDGYGSEAVSYGRGALKRIDRAYSAFYARCKQGETPGHPRWKPYHRYRTLDVFGLSTGTVKRVGEQTRIKVRGLPTLRIRKGRHLPEGKPVALSITQRGRRVWVQVSYEVEKEQMEPTGRVVGLDMGVSDRVALSDGKRIERRKPKRDRVKQAQRRLSRCKKGSRRWKERRRVLSNQQHRQRVSNRNEVHRLTTALVREHDLIVAEGLQIKNMTRSAKGTVEEPGRNVAAKSGLNRSINDQTWGMILTQLAYKAEWAGSQAREGGPQTHQPDLFGLWCRGWNPQDWQGLRLFRLWSSPRCGHQCRAGDTTARTGGWEYAARVQETREFGRGWRCQPLSVIPTYCLVSLWSIS